MTLSRDLLIVFCHSGPVENCLCSHLAFVYPLVAPVYFSRCCSRSLGTTRRSPLRSIPSASCNSSRTFHYSCSSLGSDDIFFGHPLLMVCRSCCIVSSLAVDFRNASIFSILTGKLPIRLCTMTSMSSAPPHVGLRSMYARH